MRFFIVFALVAAAAAQISNEYLPPKVGGFVGGATNAVETVESAPVAPAADFTAYEIVSDTPAHTFSETDGYRYKTQRRRVYRRQRRDVSNEYLPPFAAAEPVQEAPVAAYETAEIETAAPAHTFSDADGYRYKTLRRRVYRRQRREVSNEYLPPLASAEPVQDVAYVTPAAAYETAEIETAAPAHTFSDADGYRYKTLRRRVYRRQRRDVSTEYLPPVVSNSAEEVVYSAPAATYETEAVAPAHSFSDADGYRYKTQRRRVVYRRNRY